MSDSGAPVFENIDELLAEKITRHSREHSDGSKTSSGTAATQSTPREPRTVHPAPSGSRPPVRLIILCAVIIICMLSLLYRTSVRTSVK